ncbi:hypothetical protein HETIRDRAFT_390020 [Heterobasidion irregulare TC 32-1]|uniref:Uncharacterized protein n=1 Tax=Heterobasidion irregulare (strain TC 32-1) TaxID=747525 RepID=W4JQB2_HETIT|nr:uncharacterized protein HETIRDRAFT_390020 [Heterobasidion irregulare TC 32-1]ETW75664.1 hypothetical protein HETIRDRAFT_390020 [Heterobasidion irregulare TC 32-1]
MTSTWGLLAHEHIWHHNFSFMIWSLIPLSSYSDLLFTVSRFMVDCFRLTRRPGMFLPCFYSRNL